MESFGGITLQSTTWPCLGIVSESLEALRNLGTPLWALVLCPTRLRGSTIIGESLYSGYEIFLEA